MCNSFQIIFDKLFAAYGHQSWWPGDTPFEVMVGAILTQNTAWSNVEKAITLLKKAKLLSPEAIVKTKHESLAECLRPSGYFNIKADRVKNFCQWYIDQGKLKKLDQLPTDELRKAVLSVKGVGPETADDMLLYAFQRPVFVIDAYTRRIFSRQGLIEGGEGYETLRHLFENSLGSDVGLFNEYHALIVNHAKQHCKTKPSCEKCPIGSSCHYPNK